VAVVTITRQFGAGGSRVAELVARSLGWTVVDREFVEEVARRAGLPAEEVAARQERAPSLMERLVRTLACASPEVYVPAAAAGAPERAEERIVRLNEHVILESAVAGRAVLVGHGARFVLARAGREDALHTYVVAPREVRVRTIMERQSLAEPDAARTLDATDADRDRYVERWYGRRRQDPANYHLVLNTGWLGYDGAADLIVAAVRHGGWA